MGSITNLKENKTIFIPCECRSEILVIEYDLELMLADIAIYESYLSYSNKMSFWQRLRYIWQVLFHKKPYIDQIALSKKQLKDMKYFLNSLDLG